MDRSSYARRPTPSCSDSHVHLRSCHTLRNHPKPSRFHVPRFRGWCANHCGLFVDMPFKAHDDTEFIQVLQLWPWTLLSVVLSNWICLQCFRVCCKASSSPYRFVYILFGPQVDISPFTFPVTAETFNFVSTSLFPHSSNR
jgi:hypothetical protein